MHEGRKSNWCEFETHGVMKENGKVLGVTSRLHSQEVLFFKFRNESTRSIWSTVVYFGLCQLPIIDLFCKKTPSWMFYRVADMRQVRMFKVYSNDARWISSSWLRTS